MQHKYRSTFLTSIASFFDRIVLSFSSTLFILAFVFSAASQKVLALNDTPHICKSLSSGLTESNLTKIQNKLVFYSGSFDPPTKAHIKIIQTLGCGQPKQVIVLVNKSGEKNFKTASFERVEMLQSALKEFDSKIRYVPVDQYNKSEVKIQAAQDFGVKEFTVVIGEDSFNVLPTSEITKIKAQDLTEIANTEKLRQNWLVLSRPTQQTKETSVFKNSFLDELLALKSKSVGRIKLEDIENISSTRVREGIWSENESEKRMAQNLLQPEVYGLIKQRSLYRPFPKSLEKIQSDLFAENYQMFTNMIQKLLPKQNDLTIEKTPDFEAQQSPSSWVERYENWYALNHKLSNAEVKEFQTLADSYLLAKSGSRFFPKLAYLTYYQNKALTPKIQTETLERVSQLTLSQPRKSQKHTLNVVEYVEQRFPKSIQSFLNDGQIPIYLHNGAFQESISFHARYGFTEVYSIQIGRGNPFVRNVFVRNPGTDGIRMILHSLRTPDRKSQLVSQLSEFVTSAPTFWVEHPIAAPVFEFNSLREEQRFQPEDFLLIGMKNPVCEILCKSNEWTHEDISSGGNPITLYTHLKTGHRIVNARNAYGDETLLLLESFHQLGIRHFFMIGTTGALDSKLEIGDIVVPNSIGFIDEHFNFEDKDTRPDLSAKTDSIMSRISFSKNLALTWKSSRVQSDPHWHTGIQHGWIQTILDETVSKMMRLKENGIQSLDIETKYLGKFSELHPEDQVGAALIVSDQPLGSHDYVESAVSKPLERGAAGEVTNEFLTQLNW